MGATVSGQCGGGLSRRGYAAGLAAVALAYVALASLLPPVEDELYYWSWSRHLQASYYDHPPMVAVLIRLSTALFGDTTFGLRAGACACGAEAGIRNSFLTRASSDSVASMKAAPSVPKV